MRTAMACGMIMISGAAAAQPVVPQMRDMMIVEVAGEKFLFTDGLTVFGSGLQARVPLGALAAALELPVDVAAGQITGGGNRRPRYTIDQRQLLIDGVTEVHAPGAVYEQDGDFYVPLALAERLLAVRLTLSTEDLQLRVEAVLPLPAQERAERDSRRVALDDDGDLQTQVVRTPYALASIPSADLVLNLEGGRGGGSALRGNYDLRLAGDLLFAGYQAYVGSDQRGVPSNMRLTFERIDPDAGMAGLTRVSAGDVFSPTLALGPRSTGGRGLFITSEPLEQVSVFDRVDLRGDLPAGFDVELYVNDVLRGQERGRTDGRYEFLAVPLQRGPNLVKLIFYGPRGERREDVRSINVGSGQIPAGQLRVTAGVVQQDQPLIQLSARNFFGDVPLPGQSALRGTVNLAWGVSERLTVQGGFGSYTPDVAGLGSRALGTLGVRTSLAGFAVQADTAFDSQGGKALALGLAGRIAGVGALLRHAEYRGGFSDEVAVLLSTAQPALRSSDVRLDSDVRIGSTKRIPLSLVANRSQYVGGLSQVTGSLRGSYALAGGFVSGGIEYQAQQGPGSAGRQVNGVTELDLTLSEKWLLRGSLTSDLSGPSRNGAVALALDRRIGDSNAVRFGITQAYGFSSDTLVQIAGTWRMRTALLTVGTSYQARGNVVRFNLSLATGLIFDPFARRYRSMPPGATAMGAMAVRAVSPAADGGKAPVEGLDLYGGQGQVSTNAKGEALVTGLGVPRGRVGINVDSLADPWLTSPTAALDVRARPGRVTRHTIQLQAVAQLRMAVQLERPDGTQRAVAAIGLVLTPEKGDPRRTVTQFDGAAYVGDLAPGRWRVSLDPAQAGRLGLTLSGPVVVDVPASGGDLPLLPLLLRRVAP
jgi:hypothetical protein